MTNPMNIKIERTGDEIFRPLLILRNCKYSEKISEPFFNLSDLLSVDRFTNFSWR